MSRVFLATKHLLQRQVAVKRWPPERREHAMTAELREPLAVR